MGRRKQTKRWRREDVSSFFLQHSVCFLLTKLPFPRGLFLTCNWLYHYRWLFWLLWMILLQNGHDKFRIPTSIFLCPHQTEASMASVWWGHGNVRPRTTWIPYASHHRWSISCTDEWKRRQFARRDVRTVVDVFWRRANGVVLTNVKIGNFNSHGQFRCLLSTMANFKIAILQLSKNGGVSFQGLSSGKRLWILPSVFLGLVRKS